MTHRCFKLPSCNQGRHEDIPQPGLFLVERAGAAADREIYPGKGHDKFDPKPDSTNWLGQRVVEPEHRCHHIDMEMRYSLVAARVVQTVSVIENIIIQNIETRRRGSNAWYYRCNTERML